MRDWIHLAVALAAVSAVAARAQQVSPLPLLPPPLPSQIVVVPESSPPPPPAQAPDGGSGSAVVVTDVPTAGDDAGTPPVVAGEPDAGPGEEIILLMPKKPPPPPEPPKKITVTVMHTPRPRVEWGQAGLELGISSGVYVAGSAALLVGELLPIVIAQLFGAGDGAINVMLDVFSVANAIVLPLGTTIAIEKTKAYSRHYELEGLGWWATLGIGLAVQGINAAVTIPTTDYGSYYGAAPLIVGLGLLTPISQTVVAQVLASPRDPAAPIEGTARRLPVLLDGKGRPIPIVNVLSISF